MNDCLFCKIANGDIQVDVVYQGDGLMAFRDVSPKAPTHILIIPEKHIATLNDLQPEDAELVGNMTLKASKIAEQEGIADDGYRVLMNCNAAGGQSVFHIHLHLLGGRQMGWPPG